VVLLLDTIEALRDRNAEHVRDELGELRVVRSDPLRRL
jgi:hypothetical protein